MRLPHGLSRELAAAVREHGGKSRSHWIADLIRGAVAEHGAALQPGHVLAGTLTIVYRAEVARVRVQLARRLAGYLKEVISSQHVFLGGGQSLEVLIVQGPGQRLQEMSDAIRKVRGVQQVRLATTMALLPPLHWQGQRS